MSQSVSRPRVAIGIPSGDMVYADFAANLAAMCLNPGAEAVIVNAKGSLVAVNRNQCVGAAQAVGASHLLFIDSDMTFPLDTLKRLLAHDKDIVGGLYSKRIAPFHSLGVVWEGAPVTGGLQRMQLLPTGCLLIKMTVFERLPKPWFNTPSEGEKIMGEDVYFCDRAVKAGFEIWQDVALSQQLGHLGQTVYRLPQG